MDALAIKIGDICKKVESGTFEIVGAFLRKISCKQEKEITEGVMNGDGEPLATWARESGPGDLSGNTGKRSIEQLLSVYAWTLTNEERKRLLEYWHESAIDELSKELQSLMQQHSSKKRELTALFHEADAQVFDQVDVVGITTTGLANNADLLRHLHAKVLICEEAGEVLESHILTTFLPSIQHAILIGDHLQLRPKISNQRLSVECDLDGPKYNLDKSLFERLANLHPPDSHTSTGDGELVDSLWRSLITNEGCILRLLLLSVRPCTPTYVTIPELSHTMGSPALNAGYSGLITAIRRTQMIQRTRCEARQTRGRQKW